MTNTARQLTLIVATFLGLALCAAPARADGPEPNRVIAVDVSSPVLEELRVLLLEAGFTGEFGDGTDDVIFVPTWAVLDAPGGTWTITPDGPARCMDWATTGAECTDGVYLPWLPDFIDA